MSKEFKREERYIVIKKSHLEKHAPDHVQKHLGFVLADVRRYLPALDAVVVESDWPEYEPTWAAIEHRMTGAASWDGEGLPPVGTVCEIRNAALGTEWAEATIVFASRNVIVWEWAGEPPINGLCTAYAHAVEMRPVRTPEQIAAEERKTGIQAILDAYTYTVDSCTHHLTYRQAERLYDIGYLKQVAP